MSAQVSWSEALMAMIAMMIVLGFVLFYYCIWPIYRGFLKRKERERELYENDPRWDNAKFNFTPRIPKECINDKKYSRFAACSRTSSMRSNQDSAAATNVVCPPMYSELFETESSLGTPPSYKSHTSSLENSNLDLLEKSMPPPSKPTKAKKGKKTSTQNSSDPLTGVKE